MEVFEMTGFSDALTKKESDAIGYFSQRRPSSGPMRSIYSRIITALRLRNITSMDQLCEMSEKELKRMRGVGDKALVVISDECRNYLMNRREEKQK